MKYTVIVSDKATHMLLTHLSFLSNTSKSAASTTKKRMLDGIHSLEHMPERFPFLNEAYLPRNKYHKMYILNWYLVIYQIKDSTVYVDYIVDCRQDYSWLIH